jgi:hypothetical protein
MCRGRERDNDGQVVVNVAISSLRFQYPAVELPLLTLSGNSVKGEIDESTYNQVWQWVGLWIKSVLFSSLAYNQTAAAASSAAALDGHRLPNFNAHEKKMKPT